MVGKLQYAGMRDEKRESWGERESCEGIETELEEMRSTSSSRSRRREKENRSASPAFPFNLIRSVFELPKGSWLDASFTRKHIHHVHIRLYKCRHGSSDDASAQLLAYHRLRQRKSRPSMFSFPFYTFSSPSLSLSLTFSQSNVMQIKSQIFFLLTLRLLLRLLPSFHSNIMYRE